MDITHRFKAGVMAVKLQRKGELQLGPDKNRILPKSSPNPTAHRRDEFAKQAKDVCNKITTLRNVLLENRSAYMRIGQHLKNSAHMTDEQRDLIDRESEKFFAYYTQLLGQMRSDWKAAKRKPQQRAHLEAVQELLANYLRSVQNIYVEQKKYRVQHELETYRLLKLAADKKNIPIRPAGMHQEKKKDNKRLSKAMSDNSSEDDWTWNERDDSDDDSASSDTEAKRRLSSRKSLNNDSLDSSGTSATGGGLNDLKSQSQTSQKVALDEDIQKSQQLVDEEEAKAAKELSPEDVQMFEQENFQLFHELQGLSEEVELIEKNVVDIAQLQDIFTEKVSLQQHNIERIANAVVGATENVKDANEQIKQAIQRNAGLRVWSLFFLLVMSFALLFLDWYYD